MILVEQALLALVETAMHTSACPRDSRDWLIRRGSERGAVARIQQHFRDAPGLDHSMEDLAALTGLNPRYLIRAFREQTGLPPHRYLTGLRVHLSKRLVLSDRPLSEPFRVTDRSSV